MSRDREAQSQIEVSLTYASPEGTSDIDAAVDLGNQSTDTLGLLPIAAYREAAKRGTLLLARVDGKAVGYALYGVAKRRVRLTHLCVRQESRGFGIARQLVERISARHQDLLGIHVRCRHDYELGEMWIKLGFTQRSEQPGRGKDRTVLVNWWRDHGQPNLFTQLEETFLARAAIDLNIIRDLVDPARTDTRDVHALVDRQVSDRLELLRTAALDAEINSIRGDLRRRCTEWAQLLRRAPAGPSRAMDIRSALVDEAQASAPGFPTSTQDEYDLRHLVDAIAADLKIFITRDAKILRTFAEVAERAFGLRILHPADVIIHLDELVRAEAYRPAALLETSISRQVIGTGHDRAIEKLAHTIDGERPRDLLKLARELAVGHHDRVGLFTSDGTLIAIYCAYHRGSDLVVPLIRVADHALRDTLAQQLVFMLRQQARKSATATVIRIEDPHPSPSIRLAALEDGFRSHGSLLLAYVVDVCSSAEQVSQCAVLAARGVELAEPPQLRSSMPAAVAAEFERVWWPAKITDSRMPSYLVPIRPVYGAELLGVAGTLFARRDALGVSREHVYYRSPLGTTPQAPARLLWYVSENQHSRAEVVACSHLDSVVKASPEELHSRFRHLGVWTLDQIRSVARDDRAQALLFTNTEIFPRPVSREMHRKLAAGHMRNPIPRQATRIPSDLFAALYREGHATR